MVTTEAACFRLNVALSRDPHFESMHFPEGIPSSLAWFSLLGSRYLLYSCSLRTRNMHGLGFMYQGKKGMGLGPLKAGEKVRKRRNFAQFSGLLCHSVLLRCLNSFFTFPELSLHSYASSGHPGAFIFKICRTSRKQAWPRAVFLLHLLHTGLGLSFFWH